MQSYWGRLIICLVVIAHCYGQVNNGDDSDDLVREYKPSGHVKQAHSLPHFNQKLHRTSNQFDASSQSEAINYGKTLLVLPAIILVLFVLTVVIFQLSVCFRTLRNIFCCNGYLHKLVNKCLGREEINLVSAREKHKFIWRHFNTRLAFLLFVGLTLATSLLFFRGNRRITHGVVDMQESLSFIDDVVSSVDRHLGSMSVSSANVDAFVNKNACGPYAQKYIEDIATYTAGVTDAVEKARTYTSAVSPAIVTVDEYTTTYGIDYKNRMIATFVTAICLLLCVYVFAVLFKAPVLLRIVILATEIGVIVLAAICCIQMVFVMGSSDFCYSPADNLIAATPHGEIRTVASYYLLCDGEDPFKEPMDQAEKYSLALNKTFDKFEKYMNKMEKYTGIHLKCTDQMEDAFSNVNNFFADIMQIVEYARCPYINYVFTSTVNNAFCEEVFSGVYIMWITMTIGVTCLLFTMIVTGLLYPHYRANFVTRIRRLCCVCIFTLKGIHKLTRRRLKRHVLRKFLDDAEFDDISTTTGSSVVYDERSYSDEDSVLDDVFFTDDSASGDSDGDVSFRSNLDDELDIELAQVRYLRGSVISSERNVLHRYTTPRPLPPCSPVACTNDEACDGVSQLEETEVSDGRASDDDEVHGSNGNEELDRY